MKIFSFSSGTIHGQASLWSKIIYVITLVMNILYFSGFILEKVHLALAYLKRQDNHNLPSIAT